MNIDKETDELRKGCRLSKRAIPVLAMLLVIAIGFFWLLERFFAISFWVKAIVVGMALFTLIGDILNVYFSKTPVEKAGKGCSRQATTLLVRLLS